MIAAKKLMLGGRRGGQALFETPGDTQWVCPSGVRSVCAVAVGMGLPSTTSDQGLRIGGAGGGLGWKNNIPVTPGQSYLIRIDNSGSFFISASTVCGRAGTGGDKGGGFVGDGGGPGGNGANGSPTSGGGGAGGYKSAGGDGALQGQAAKPGSGGGGAGGVASGGGGVGLMGEGPSGTTAGQAGSGGQNANGSSGGKYGGGGANGNAPGGIGGVRLIWGRNRAFPSLNTGDL